jgi:uncharacterized CHY-type Zn-finger protein
MQLSEDNLQSEAKHKQDKAKISNWVCPLCSKSLTTYVAVSEPPTCQNPLSHSSKSIEMIQNRREKIKVA